MHKNVKTMIGVAVFIVILVIAYRILGGSGGSIKLPWLEVDVDAESAKGVNANVEIKKNKILKQFKYDFNFKNRACDTNTNASIQKCVDAGYILDGVVGDVNITKHDRCGSAYIGFEKISETCGNVNVHLQGCGFDSVGDCVSHAFLEGEFLLQGYTYE